MEACQYVATAPMSRLKWEFCEQSSFASFAFGAPASTQFLCRRASRRNGAQAGLGNGRAGGGGGNSLSRESNEEGNVLQDISSLFCSCEKLKAMVDDSLNSGVGLDMRNRVDHLFKRVYILKETAERAARFQGGRVPAQLITSFKGLQREHTSLENIVRLATEAGPVLIKEDSNNEHGLTMAAQEGTLSMRYGAESVNVELTQEQNNEASVEVLSGPKYVMSTQPSEGSSKLTSIRAEIERRVMEQLVKKQFRQPIVNSVQDYTGQESKLKSFQKVPSVSGQRDIGDNKVPHVNGRSDTEDMSEADTVVQAGKGSLPQMMEAKQRYQATALDTSKDMETRQLQIENARTVSLEMHQQMVTRFEKALLDLREQLSQVFEDLKKKETMLVGVQEKLMGEQHKLMEKINELSIEITRRLTVEELNHTLQNALNELENKLKNTQNQVASLCFALEKKEKLLTDFQKEQERVKQEFQADVLSLRDKFCRISGIYEGFEPQSIVMDLGSVKAMVSALQNNQTLEHAKIVDWQEKLETLEKAVCYNDKQIKDLNTDVDSRVEKREVNDVLKNVMDEMESRSKQLQDHMKLIDVEQEKNKTVIGLLQEDRKTYRNELQTLTTQYDLNVQGILAELSKTKKKLNDLQEEQKHERASVEGAQQQMADLEAKGLELAKRISEEAQSQKQALLDEVQGILAELSKMKKKVNDLQEEQKHERASVEGAQQQMADLEVKGLELVKRISEEAQSQKQALLVEVRTLVEEMLQASYLRPGAKVEDAFSMQESNAAKLDVTRLRDLINDSGKQTSSSTPSNHDQNNETSHKGAQGMPDQRTSSLEAFFSVMGQLIRQELKRVDATSSQSLPSVDLHNSGEPSQHGSGVTYESKENQGQNLITLRYESSWNRAFVHYCADNCGWTEVPGFAMEEASNIKGKYWKEFKIKAARLEFVMTDGRGNWDRAPNGCNYVVEKPGMFELSAGVLKAVASTK